MLLEQFKTFYTIVERYDCKCIAFNDHNANIVIQFSKGDIEEILKEIRRVLPAGMSVEWTYMANQYEITFKEGGDIMRREYEQQAKILDAAIQGEFGPIDWFDQTLHEDSTYSITLIGPHVDTDNDETCTSISFIAREDGFFSKMHKIKNMIKYAGYNVELIKFEANKDCPYSEATINVKLDGSEL